MLKTNPKWQTEPKRARMHGKIPNKGIERNEKYRGKLDGYSVALSFNEAFAFLEF